jgi:hypothetical protein
VAAVPVSLAGAHAAHAGRPFGALAFSVVFLVIGALLVFDVAGLATQIREQNRDVTAWGRWVREHWDPPDAPTFVGWIFLLFGAFSTIYFLFKVAAPRKPVAGLVTIVLCAVLGVFGLWLVPELWRGPSGRRPHPAHDSRLVRIRVISILFMMTAIAYVWPLFVVPPRLRDPTRLPDLR